MNGWETDWSRDALERIVALLFSLAGLADRAAGVSFLRRRRLLGILTHGEAEARAFLIGMATGAPIQADELETTGDAALLAVRLRALALMLCVLLMQAPPNALPGMAGSWAGRTLYEVSTIHRPDSRALSSPDTS
jgi:hypothetical protein